jgi:hypothetical protein
MRQTPRAYHSVSARQQKPSTSGYVRFDANHGQYLLDILNEYESTADVALLAQLNIAHFSEKRLYVLMTIRTRFRVTSRSYRG